MTKKRNLTEFATEVTEGFFYGVKKPLNATEQAILEKYNAGMTKQTDIAESIGKDKGTVSRALKRIREEFPEMLQEDPQKPVEEPKNLDSKNKPEIKKTQETPQKVKKQVFSFRAALTDIARWKAYTTATGQTMESIGTAAMNDFLERQSQNLTENQKVIFGALISENIDM